MTREELELRMDDAACNYARTDDPKYEAEVWAHQRHIGRDAQGCVLEQAVARCRNEDMRTAEVYEALDFLAARAEQKWPFEQFRKALDEDGAEAWQVEGRWQVLNASLNGIKLALLR